jgi:hypothetical protein
MLRKVILAAVVVLTACAAGMAVMDEAQAFPFAARPQTLPVVNMNDGLQLAAYCNRKKGCGHGKAYHHGKAYRHGKVYHGRAYVHGGAWRYSARYGPRYAYWHAGYGYYYGGYWYARPWWTIGVGPVVVYNAALYGPRYRYRRAGYGFYHGGYYYRRRWW